MLKQVIIFFRHGIRTPIYHHNLCQWNVGPGQLTQIGQEQLDLLGNFLRYKYFNKLGIENLSKELQFSDQIKCFSSHHQRAQDRILSLFALLKGFLKINSNNDFQFEHILRNQTKISKKGDDYLFHGRKIDVCPRAKLLEKQVESSEFIRNKLKYYQKSVFKDVAELINYYFKTNYQPEQMNFKDFSRISDFFTCGIANKKENFPQISKQLKEKIIEAKKFQLYNVKYGCEQLVQTGCTIPFSRIISLLNENNQQLKPTISFFSGHDTSLIPILKTFLCLKNEDDLKKFSECPFNSTIIIEQFENLKETKIKIYFNFKEIIIPSLTHYDNEHKTEDFKQFLKLHQIENLQKFCQI